MPIILRNLHGKERELNVTPIRAMLSLPVFGEEGGSPKLKTLEHKPFVWKGKVTENGLKIFEEVELKPIATRMCGRLC